MKKCNMIGKNTKGCKLSQSCEKKRVKEQNEKKKNVDFVGLASHITKDLLTRFPLLPGGKYCNSR